MRAADSPAIVCSVYQPAICAINDLERRIVEAEDDTDAKLWEQARCVVEQLEAGLSQRELDAQWVDVRTGPSRTRRRTCSTRPRHPVVILLTTPVPASVTPTT